MKKLPFIAIIIMTLSGCVRTNTVKLGNAATHDKVSYESVAVYLTAKQVPGKYEEIALLNSKGDSAFTNESRMIKSMQRKAAALGANAIILDAMSEPSAGSKVAAAFLLGAGAERKGRAIAIYVLPSTSKK